MTVATQSGIGLSEKAKPDADFSWTIHGAPAGDHGTAGEELHVYSVSPGRQ